MTSAEALEMVALVEKHDERMRAEGAARMLDRLVEAYSDTPGWAEMDLDGFVKICRQHASEYRAGTRKI